MRSLKKSLVFFEAPHRLQSFLQDCSSILGNRELLWCRELTKMHEEHFRGRINSILSILVDTKIKGESVLIISGAENAPEMSDKEIKDLLMTYKKSGKWSLKDSVQKVTKEHNLSRSTVYRLALKIWK